jgi:hypothetical protein
VFRSPEIDGCALTSVVKIIPTYDTFIKSLKNYYPNIPLQCPIKPGKFEFSNVSYTEKNVNQNLGFQGNGLYSYNLPNGKHLTVLKMFTLADPTGVTEWVSEVKKRLQNDNF